MTRESLLNRDWQDILRKLGGAAAIEASARETKAFQRARVLESAVDLLRVILAYCLGGRGLRATAAWASSIGLVDISNVALLLRLRNCGDWLTQLIGQVLSSSAPQATHGRLIRIIDGTTVPKAGTAARTQNKLWRVHAAFDLPAERFGFFQLTDETGGETLDRAPVVKGEIRIGDRAYLQPDRMAEILDAGGDILLRSGWRAARWLDAEGEPINILDELRAATKRGLIDRPIWIARKSEPALKMRLVAVKKPAPAAAEARRKARLAASKGGNQISKGTLSACDWVILITSLNPDTFSSADIFALYRLRWRIELAFKRLKSLLALRGPPGIDERSARPFVLAHLLLLLLLEPLVDEFEDSPRLPFAA